MVALGQQRDADGSAAASWNGYRGLTWNRRLKDFTVAPEALLNLPMWYACVRSFRREASRLLRGRWISHHQTQGAIRLFSTAGCRFVESW